MKGLQRNNSDEVGGGKRHFSPRPEGTFSCSVLGPRSGGGAELIIRAGLPTSHDPNGEKEESLHFAETLFSILQSYLRGFPAKFAREGKGREERRRGRGKGGVAETDRHLQKCSIFHRCVNLDERVVQKGPVRVEGSLGLPEVGGWLLP